MKANLFGVAGAALAFLGVVSLAYSATFGFLYSDGRYTTIAPPGSTGSEAFDINDRGQIVGDLGGVTVTPLPPTWMMMMLAGLAGFGLLSYRRKRTLSAAAARFFGFGLGGVAPALTLGNGSPTLMLETMALKLQVANGSRASSSLALRFKFLALAMLACATCCFAFVPFASASTVAASGAGWCASYNLEPCNNTNTSVLANDFAGFLGDEGHFQNWYFFNIPNIPITSATLSIFNNCSTCAGVPSDTYTVYAATLIGYGSLVSGSALGAVNVGTADAIAPGFVDIVLNPTGVALLNSAAGGSFLFGGGTDNPGGGPNSGIFGADQTAQAELIFNGAATPLPAALPLFATGLGALGLLGWRRKRKNAAVVAAP